MQEVPKDKVAKRDDIIGRLEKVTDNITDAAAKANEYIAELNDEIQKYNNILREADELCTYVVNEITDYVGPKSDGWKEEHGDAYSDWESPWTNIVLSPIDVVSEVELEDMDHAADLAELPLAPEQ